MAEGVGVSKNLLAVLLVLQLWDCKWYIQRSTKLQLKRLRQVFKPTLPQMLSVSVFLVICYFKLNFYICNKLY